VSCRAEKRQPKINQGVAIATLIITVGLMAVTAEWLVDSVELIQEGGGILEEYVSYPFFSFSLLIPRQMARPHPPPFRLIRCRWTPNRHLLRSATCCRTRSAARYVHSWIGD
jgi:hypothetical protein